MPQSVIKKGITTIFWGTDALTQGGANTIGAAVVESIGYKPVTVDAEISTNEGTTGTIVVIDNGFDAELKCVYDTAITWPVLGDLISLKSPLHATKLPVVVVGVNEEAARKKEAMIGFSVKYRPDLGLAAP